MPLSALFLYSSSDSVPAIAFPFGMLLLIMAVRVFHGIFTTPGSHNGSAFEARHKDDLCRYCDAYRTGDGEIHHAPSCRNR